MGLAEVHVKRFEIVGKRISTTKNQ